MTTYVDSYPSFRRFIVDVETMLPIEIETYRLDVEDSNPEFVFDHELKSHFGLSDLSPKSFDELSDRLLVDGELALKFLKTKSQHGSQFY